MERTAITRPMQASGEPRSGSGRVLAALRIVHPFPTSLNVAATAALALIAAGTDIDRGLLLRMMAAMLLIQSAIGVANDVFDRELDAATKPYKPLVSGAVSLRAATWIFVTLLCGAIGLAATLGAAGFGLAMLGMACGLAYDAKLKRTVFSAAPFMVAIPTLPFWIWATLDEWGPVLWWLAPLGGLIGLSLHLANTLPDIDDDAAHGVRGLPHTLGKRTSMVVAWAAFGCALALATAIAPAAGYNAGIIVPTLLLGAACLAVSVGLWIARREDASLRTGFGVMAAGAAATALGWLAAVTY